MVCSVELKLHDSLSPTDLTRSTIVSYQVIARKYRPQTFSDLTGQEHITRTLSQALDNRRLHHAYLFSGVRGTGKTTTARILAKCLNCQTGMTSKPCLQCASCLEIAAGNSLDVLEIDAASNTGVDNVRDVIINNIAMAPARDRYKIFVIDEVHMLSTSAFNALLKTLEEPPAHVVFVMATTELHKVPDTILSRCQHFEFRQIPTEKIFRRLRDIAVFEEITISDQALLEIARAGAGSLRDAQSAFDQVIAFSGVEITEENVGAALGLVGASTLGRFVETIAKRDTSSMLDLVDEVFSRGYDLRNLTRELMAYLRHLLVVKSGIVSSDILGVADVEITRLKELSRFFSEEDLVRCFHLLAETEKEIKDSPHPRFQLEIGLVKLTHAARLRTLDELINRLEELEARLSGGPGGSSGEGSDFSKTSVRAPQSSPSTVQPPAKSSTGKDESDHKSTVGRIQPNIEKTSLQRDKPANSMSSEPPDLSDFDLTEPIDLPDSDSIIYSDKSDKATAVQTQLHPAVPPAGQGREVEAVLMELQRLNRGLVLTSLEDAQKLEFRDGAIIATFGGEDMFARRLRDSNTLFRDIGERLFGQPLRIEVKISGQVEERVDEAELKRNQLRLRAMQNPAVRLLLEQTRGEIVWVKEKE
jgi:DNA polymerase-3 subunit gamma/tau